MDNRDIWVIAECKDGVLRESSAELFTAAKTVTDVTGGGITCVLLGADTMAQAAKEAAAYGAGRVICAESAELREYSAVRYTAVLESLIREYAPDAVMISATGNGKDLAPRLARRLKTGITANCTELSADAKTGLISWNMPAPGGIMATILCEHTRPQMGTVCPGAFRKGEPDMLREAVVETRSFSDLPDDGVTLVKRELTPKSTELDVAAADIIVAGGRGLGSAENLELVRELARLLGAAVGASRAAVDMGWAEQKNLIGQTGKLVRPKLYIACGISGALQHLVGVADADCIVAINTDANAPINDVADYIVTGDAVAILRSMIDKLKNK